MMESTSTFRLLSSTLLKRLTVNTRLIKEVEIFNCSYILHLIRVWFIPQSSSSLPSTQSSWPLHTPRMSVHDLSRMHVNSPISHAATTTTTNIVFYTLFVVVRYCCKNICTIRARCHGAWWRVAAKFVFAFPLLLPKNSSY